MQSKPVEQLVLGIEGGASKTDWIYLKAVDSNTAILGKGQLPSSNLKLTSESHLKQMFEQLPEHVTHAGIFLAGCVTQSDRNQLQNLTKTIWPEAQIRVGSDRDSALAAAFGNEDGISVISGTGSAVTGRKGGKIEKAGGRGHLLGDRGGAYVICIEGLRLALRRYDLEHQTSNLAQSILQALSLSDMEDLMNWVQLADKTAISSLAPVVFEAALEGDQEILAVIEAGACTLAKYTDSVARWLNFEKPAVKLAGGIFLNQPVYITLYEKEMDLLMSTSSISICTTPGSLGAAWLAVRDPDFDDSQAGKMPATHSAGEMPALHEELERATTEQQNPRSAGLENLKTSEMIQLLIDEEIFVSEALHIRKKELQKAVDLALKVFQGSGRLFYVGAGTSGRLGVLDASEIPPTFGEPPSRVQGIIAGGIKALYRSVEGAEDDPLKGAISIIERGVSQKDLVCGITASGRTPFVLGALQQAKEIGAKTILLTCNPARNRTDSWNVEIDLPTGPELITGSTRLKAGTATKVALNILTTCSMIQLGKTKGSWMIDLKPANEKLRFRSIRLVSRFKGISNEEAEKLLEASGWNIRKVLQIS